MLNVCNRIIPNLYLKDRTYRHTAWGSNLTASTREVGNVNLMDVQTLAIDCKQKRIGRRVLSNHWKEGMRDESPQRLAEEGTIANGLLLIHIPHGSRTGEHNQAVLPFSLVRWNRLSSPHNSSTEDQPVSTQGGAAPQETSDQPDSAYTPLHFNTHNPHKYA